MGIFFRITVCSIYIPFSLIPGVITFYSNFSNTFQITFNGNLEQSFELTHNI